VFCVLICCLFDASYLFVCLLLTGALSSSDSMCLNDMMVNEELGKAMRGTDYDVI
jgi:hypothetical protein